MNDRAPGLGRPCLSVLNSPLIGQRFILGGPFAVIGRNPECEVQLDLVSISRQHAVIEEANGRFVIRDMGSRNGIKVKGRAVARAELSDGDVITVGEVDLRFERGAQAPIASAVYAAPAPARALTAADIMAAARMESEIPDGQDRAEPAAASGRNPKLIVAIALGLLIAAGVGVWVVRPRGRGAAGRVRELTPIMVKVNGNRVVSWPGSWGDFRPGNIFIDEPMVVEASRYSDGYLLLTGKSGGNATVSVRTNAGLTLTCRVLVRGRIPEPDEELTYARHTDAERLSMANRFCSQAEMLEAEKPFLALQNYEKTLAALKPMPNKGQLYLKAKGRAEALREIIEAAWKKLENDIRIAARNGDLPRVEELVADAVELIPDENDPRHQRAVATKTEVLLRVLKEKNR